MDMLVMGVIEVFFRFFLLENKFMNNMDNCRNIEIKDGLWINDNLSVFRRYSRFFNVYVGVFESNL